MAVEAPVESLTASNIEDALADDVQETPSVTKSDFDFSLLKDDEDDKEVEEPKEEEKELEEEEKDEEKEEETEEESELKVSEDEDELELAKIPKRQEIKKAFPDLFKKFPALEHALYREQQYAEVFPSIKDAKEAKSSVEQFNGFQAALLNGDIESTLRAVKSTNAKAFEKITNNLLDSLVRIDGNAHLGITRQVSKGVLNYIHNAAGVALKRNPEDKRAQQLQIASELIHGELFNDNEVTPDRPQRVEEENPEQARLTAERSKFEQERFTAAFNTVSASVNTLLTNAVAKEIDVKGILPPYVKSTLVRDVMAELDRQLVGDTRFKQLIDKLWLRAKENGYSDQSMNNIKTALREKAKTVLPGIMRAKKGEALKGLTTQPAREKRELVRNDREERPASDKKRVTLSRKEDDRMKPRQGESNLDFLMRD